MTICKSTIVFIGMLLAFQPAAYASSISFEGIFALDTTSIVGTNKNDKFFFRLTLDGDSLDTDHIIDLVPPDDTVRAYGRYNGAVTNFQMARDPRNAGDWDPSSLTYNLAESVLLTTDVNPPPPFPDPLGFMTEKMTIAIRVTSEVTPVKNVNLNLYNSTLITPLATRQLWLDTSTPTNGFTLSDLFLHGMPTLSEFKSIPERKSEAFVDSVFLDGGVTFGSGTVQSLAPVPLPATIALFGVGLAALGGLGLARRRHAS